MDLGVLVSPDEPPRMLPQRCHIASMRRYKPAKVVRFDCVSNWSWSESGTHQHLSNSPAWN
eukprot:scaffold14064_cov503-Alexandrium_tamarense.AAC.1